MVYSNSIFCFVLEIPVLSPVINNIDNGPPKFSFEPYSQFEEIHSLSFYKNGKFFI